MRESAEQTRAMGYEIGQTIKINSMDLEGEPNPQDIINRYFGKTGVITYIDGLGQLIGTWGGLNLNPYVDNLTIVK